MKLTKFPKQIIDKHGVWKAKIKITYLGEALLNHRVVCLVTILVALPDIMFINDLHGKTNVQIQNNLQSTKGWVKFVVQPGFLHDKHDANMLMPQHKLYLLTLKTFK